MIGIATTRDALLIGGDRSMDFAIGFAGRNGNGTGYTITFCLTHTGSCATPIIGRRKAIAGFR